jgi:S-DNA-T family DNA segregation ATPase FtsK/SpoIIIE
LLAPRRSPLIDVDGWEHAARTPDECQAAAARLVAFLNAGDDLGPGGMVIVIDDGEELEDTAAANDLALVARRGRDLGVRIVGAAEIRSAHRAFSGWMTEVRKEQQGLLLDPDSDIDGDLFGARLPRRTQRAYPPGRGFLVRRGEPELIQVARSENRD